MNSQTKILKPIVGRNKRPLVVEALTSLARKIGAGGKLPTMQELSRSLKVAIATLDDCLGIVESRGIIYRKQGSGIYVAPRLSQKRMGLVFGRNIFCPGASPFYSILLQQCLKQAQENGVRFSFYFDSPELSGTASEVPVHHDLAEALREQKLDGLAICNLRSTEQEEWLLAQGVPLVTFGSGCLNPYQISTDYDRLVEMGVESLVASGCKNIGFIGACHTHAPFFRRALRKRTARCRQQWIIHPEPDADAACHLREQIGREAILKLAEKNGKRGGGLPDGLLITDDMIARGACTQLEALGYQVGREIEIASHANKGSLALSEWDGEMMLLEMNPREMVNAIFRLLQPLMDGMESPPASPILLKPTLKRPRESAL